MISFISLSDVILCVHIYRAAEKSRATIYTVVPGFKLLGLSQEEQTKRVTDEFVKARERLLSGLDPLEKQKRIEAENSAWRPLSPANLQARTTQAYKVQLALSGLSQRTGGWTDFLETPEQAPGIYSRIFDDINQRYIIGYYPTNKVHDGQLRKISVAIRNHPEYVVVGRKAYYAR